LEESLAAESAAVETEGIAPLPPHELRRVTDPKTLGFKTTADIEPAAGLAGQERALAAIAFGAAIRAADFNVFVLGPPGTGKSAAVTAFLQGKAASAPTPPDWVYVHNFADPNRPRALALPPGRAASLAHGMRETLDELRTILPLAFEGEHYHIGRRAIEEEFLSGHEDALDSLKAKAQAQGIAIQRTPAGFAMAPTHEGKAVKPEVYQQLPEKMQQDVAARVDAMQAELQDVLARMPAAERLRRARLRELDEEIAARTVVAAFAGMEAAFADLPGVLAYLGDAGADLIRNASLFLGRGGEGGGLPNHQADVARDPRFRRYMVNVLVSRGGEEEGAPVHEETNPSHDALAGRVEHGADMSGTFTDFLLIRPGALHKANGGYLLIDARGVLLAPRAWETLKRTLKAGAIRVEPPLETAAPAVGQTLDPEPIPLDVKVFLIGGPEHYDLLSGEDPDFRRLFQVEADFEESMPRWRENEAAFAQVIASIAAYHNLLPLDASGAARLIDESARIAGDRERISVEIGRIADIAREANHWAEEAGRDAATNADVARAIDEQIRRASRAREAIGRDAAPVETSGEKVGQITGLWAAKSRGVVFGRPGRITARVRFGSGRGAEIAREAAMGAPPERGGAAILWGYLAGRYARDIPLALAATLVFEHPLGGADGSADGGGASCAELFALLSALSETPVRQGVAVAGGVDQLGETHAAGRVNEKIESFFDVCEARGLTGGQGVIVPRENARHLMLRDDIVDAARRRTFHVWGIATADEGMELLTGVSAGAENAGGGYPARTINRRIEDKLRLFAERARIHGDPKAFAEKEDDYYDRARRRGR